MEDANGALSLTSMKYKEGGKGGKEGRIGRSRTPVLAARQAGSRVKSRAKGSNDDTGPYNHQFMTSRSSDLKQIHELGSERRRASLSSIRRTSFGPLSSHRVSQKTSSRTLSPGLLSATTSTAFSVLPSSRTPAAQVTESSLADKLDGIRRGRERRSRSLVVREHGRRRSSSVLSSPHAAHFSAREVMLQESQSSSRDSDGSRGWSSMTCALGRSVSDRASGPKSRRSLGCKREGSIRSPTRSPQSDRFRVRNFELVMAQPKEDTLEHIFKLKSDCSGSKTEALSMKGIVSSLIAIENEEV